MLNLFLRGNLTTEFKSYSERQRSRGQHHAPRTTQHEPHNTSRATTSIADHRALTTQQHATHTSQQRHQSPRNTGIQYKSEQHYDPYQRPSPPSTYQLPLGNRHRTPTPNKYPRNHRNARRAMPRLHTARRAMQGCRPLPECIQPNGTTTPTRQLLYNN
jgi:hypothetical protein